MKRYIRFIACCFCLVFIILSCSDKPADIPSILREWQGKKIKIPKDLIFTKYAVDTIDYTYLNRPFKTFVYVDSLDCLSCKLQLSKWKKMILVLDSVTNHNISFLFILDVRNVSRMEEILRENRFDYPVVLDTKGKLNRLNHFPTDTRFQTFLLDKENKVLVVGNPVQKEAIKELFIKQVLNTR